jgi:protein-tyrosine phosphatase
MNRVEKKMNDDDRRRLAAQNLYNARELGGYPAARGKQVKWGVFFRSADLACLIPADRLLLEKAGIKSVVDFRNDAERQSAPDSEIGTVTKTLRLAIDAANMIDLSRVGEDAAGAVLMEGLNCTMVDQARPQYAAFFRLISESGNTPVLFHCSAGKDRTGLAAALVLSALGAPRETVIADYVLSHTYLEGRYRELIQTTPYLAPLLTVKPSYLEAALDHIDETYGSMEIYLEKELGADLERLRELYTE